MADPGENLHFGPVSARTQEFALLSHRGNRLLDTLPRESRELIESHLHRVAFTPGQVLEQDGQPPFALYFPVRGGVSLELGVGKRAVQLTLIGRDGLVGTSLLLGGLALGTARVQFEGTGWRISAAALQACLEESPQLHRHLLVAVDDLLARISRVAWGSACGLVENRLAAWLITATDCLETDHIAITQQAMSEVLGVRRPSVTLSLQALERKGIARHRRGGLVILDKQRLAEIAGDRIGCNEV